MRGVDLDDQRAGRPWGALLFFAAFGVYLVWRIVQMIGWLVKAIVRAL